MKTKTVKKIMAGLGVIAIGLAGFSAGLGVAPEHTVTKIVTQKIPEIHYVNVTKEIVKEVPKEIIKNVTVEVPFEDISFKEMTCDRLMYDDMDTCVKEVKAEDKTIQDMINYINEKFRDVARELEDAGLVNDYRDVELVKIYSDYSDLNIIDSNYDDREYEIKFKIKINDDHTHKYQYVTLEMNEGDIEITNVN